MTRRKFRGAACDCATGWVVARLFIDCRDWSVLVVRDFGCVTGEKCGASSFCFFFDCVIGETCGTSSISLTAGLGRLAARLRFMDCVTRRAGPRIMDCVTRAGIDLKIDCSPSRD